MMKRLLISLAFMSACGNDGPKVDYSKCKGASRIVVADDGINQPDGLAIPSGDAVDISLQVLDDEGHRCDPKGMSVTSDDSARIDVVEAPEPTMLDAPRDFLDVGDEPTANLTASLGTMSQSWPANGVVNLGGEWNVTVTEARKFPAGFNFGIVTFEQHGRNLIWKNCTLAQACDRAGTVQDDKLLIVVPTVGLNIAVQISPDRQHLAGEWSARTSTSDYMGTFNADRAQKK